jgi:hypothetical protein
MPNEPINIFAARGDARGVLDHLKGLFPDAEVEAAGDTWTAVTVRLGSNGDSRALTILHDPDYYAGPDWPKQRAGMQGYFDRFPAGDRKPQLMATIGSLGFALATAFEPDFDPEGDERLGVVFELARLLDGVLFTPSALRDASGRVLAGADGEYDAEAIWPGAGPAVPQLAQAPPSSAGPVADSTPRPPTPKRAVRRAVALMGVVARAVIEREVKLGRTTPEQAGGMHDKLLGWLAAVGVETEFEPAEEALVHAPPGRLADQGIADALWRVEGLAVIGWAVGRLDLPKYDELVDLDVVWDGLGLLQVPEVKAMLARPIMRPRGEMETVRQQMLGYHWRMREFRRSPKAVDFRAFAQDGPLGTIDLTPFELMDDDLAVLGHRIDSAPPEVLDACASIASERHRAINWLCWGPEAYSETDVST